MPRPTRAIAGRLHRPAARDRTRTARALVLARSTTTPAPPHRPSPRAVPQAASRSEPTRRSRSRAPARSSVRPARPHRRTRTSRRVDQPSWQRGYPLQRPLTKRPRRHAQPTIKPRLLPRLPHPQLERPFASRTLRRRGLHQSELARVARPLVDDRRSFPDALEDPPVHLRPLTATDLLLRRPRTLVGRSARPYDRFVRGDGSDRSEPLRRSLPPKLEPSGVCVDVQRREFCAQRDARIIAKKGSRCGQIDFLNSLQREESVVGSPDEGEGDGFLEHRENLQEGHGR